MGGRKVRGKDEVGGGGEVAGEGEGGRGEIDLFGGVGGGGEEGGDYTVCVGEPEVGRAGGVDEERGEEGSGGRLISKFSVVLVNEVRGVFYTVVSAITITTNTPPPPPPITSPHHHITNIVTNRYTNIVTNLIGYCCG